VVAAAATDGAGPRGTAIVNLDGNLGTLAILLVLIGCSGFFSAAETALFSISKVRARHLAKSGNRRDQLIRDMKEDAHTLLSTILIGNNLVNIGASALATALALELFGHNGVGIATGVMTFLILVFGEIFPKSAATRNNVGIARLVIVPLRWLSFLFWPVIRFLDFIPRVTGMVQRRQGATEQELLTYVEMIAEEGEIHADEKELIEKIFRLDDTTVSAIMTPRTEMYVVDLARPPELTELTEVGYTRIPIVDGSVDNLVGVLNIKDLFTARAAGRPDTDLRQLMHEPFFVPMGMTLDRLLKTFKRRRQHLAVVVDEYGGVAGLVTLEDVLEEIVGEIIDETDEQEPNVVAVKPGEWIVRGRSPLADVSRATGMLLADVDDYDTFTGFVITRLQRVPKKNDQLNVGDFQVTVREAHGPRIREYLVRRCVAEPCPPPLDGEGTGD
jgi:CBS domain containing-hemolysin-like protein